VVGLIFSKTPSSKFGESCEEGDAPKSSAKLITIAVDNTNKATKITIMNESNLNFLLKLGFVKSFSFLLNSFVLARSFTASQNIAIMTNKMFNERKFFPSNQRIVDNATSMYPSRSLPGLKKLASMGFL
jgi:hypothetical protein